MEKSITKNEENKLKNDNLRNSYGELIKKFPGKSNLKKLDDNMSGGYIFQLRRNIYVWKKCVGLRNEDVLVKMLVPKGALVRCTPNDGDKIRVSKAIVVSMKTFHDENIDAAFSTADAHQNLQYLVGKTMRPYHKFNMNPAERCASGIHCYFDELRARAHK